jgi:hypothetical protein
MIHNIIDLLKHVNGETENIRIAQGKYYLPDTLSEAFKTIKKETQWRRSTK